MNASLKAARSSATHAILLRVAYDGAPFSGCALQSNAQTVAGVLFPAIRQMDAQSGGLRLASRTDAGVHALEQFIAFDTSSKISSRGWLLGLTSLVPPQVAITQVSRVEPGFHPAKQAVLKLYRYLILRGTIRDPFLEDRAWRVFQSLDDERMRAEMQALVGEHDFRAFRSSSDKRTNTVRHIHRVSLEENSHRVLAFEIEGDRFLHNMVRIIVGSLVDIGRGKVASGAFDRAFVSGERTELGMTAPASGLYLARLILRTEGTDKWPYQ